MNIIQIILKNINEGWTKFKIKEKDLSGKTILITGGNDGIGFQTAVQLAKMNAKIIIASRNVHKSTEAVKEVKKLTGNDNISSMPLDLSSLESVKQFTQDLKTSINKLDILINNAGGYFFDYKLTDDGFERTFQINHLGPFTLTLGLLPLLYKGDDPRIINLSSKAHAFHQLQLPEDLKVKKEDYTKMKAYSKSKLMNVLFTKELAKRLEGRNIKVVAVHPGFVKTGIGLNDVNMFTWIFTKIILFFVHNLIARNPDEGAKTTVFTAIDDSIVSGEYYDSCIIGETQPQAYDSDLAKKLWDSSAELAGISSEIPSN